MKKNPLDYLVIISLFITVVVILWVYLMYQNKQYEYESKHIPVIDEHGCIITSGYSWCDSSLRCIDTWVEKCDLPKSNI